MTAITVSITRHARLIFLCRNSQVVAAADLIVLRGAA